MNPPIPRRLLAQLRRYAAGRVIYIPVMERKVRNLDRDRAIRRHRAAGASITALAVKYHLSEARIWELCRGLHPDRHRRQVSSAFRSPRTSHGLSLGGTR